MDSMNAEAEPQPLWCFAWGSGWVGLYHWVYLLLWNKLPPETFNGEDHSLSISLMLTVVGGCIGAFAGIMRRRASGLALLLGLVMVLGTTATVHSELARARHRTLSNREVTTVTVGLFALVLSVPVLFSLSILPARNFVIRSLAGGLVSVTLLLLVEQRQGTIDLARIIRDLPILLFAAVCLGLPGNPPCTWAVTSLATTPVR